ncbi:hypothetical protein Tel_12585 [Candidatus Tenderia electrophaga]|jgi:uncharacterized protein YeaO (DUF488 family)|uniref:MarR family transcriptional regulator n=1 Tax=Candidatus Tenderia electrophaga TaxID=1748243 RepID=A0A0S2TFH7_9GAMM|nr:hypothetical protein Tel_12585 [Candidatus Tenderia electrophaga]
MQIWLRRAYEPPGAHDGTRVLVDRLWPRGVSKQQAAIDHWFKDLAPTQALRGWYGHDLERWPQFQARYRDELEKRRDQVGELCKLVDQGRVTLVYAARDEEHSNARVLKDYLEQRC